MKNNKLAQIQTLIKSGKYDKAKLLLKKIKQADKTEAILDWEAYCYAKTEKWPLAIACWQEALSKTSSSDRRCDILLKISEAQYHLRQYEQAIQTLINSLDIDASVNNITARLRLCELCLKVNDYNKIEKYGVKLLSYESSHSIALKVLARSAFIKGDKPLVMERLAPFYKLGVNLTIEQICFVTDLLIRMNEIQKAKEFISTFEDKYRDESWMKVFHGMIYLESDEYQRAIELLKNVNLSKLPEWLAGTSAVDITLAKAYDKQGMYDLAFKYYQNVSKLSKSRLENFVKYDAISAYKKVNIDKLRRLEVSDSPIFMLGFPRSGTTLLETILDLNQGIATLSEPDTITFLGKEINYLKNTKGFVQGLPKLTQDNLLVLKAAYFDKVSSYFGDESGEIENKLIVDKMPLYTLYLPLIDMVFPKTKFIVNIRHPLDVVLSNFQQNFQLNDQMSFLVSLEECVERYCRVMSFLEKMKDTLKLDFIQIRYEDLVDNIEIESTRLFNFLGVKSISNVEDFHKHALQKVVNTASKSQVTKPLYRSSRYKWKNYEKHLAPFIPKLMPFIEKYGYTVD